MIPKIAPPDKVFFLLGLVVGLDVGFLLLLLLGREEGLRVIFNDGRDDGLRDKIFVGILVILELLGREESL